MFVSISIDWYIRKAEAEPTALAISKVLTRIPHLDVSNFRYICVPNYTLYNGGW